MAKSDMTDSEENGKKLPMETEFSGGTSRQEVGNKTSEFSSETSSESLCVANKNHHLSTHISILIASLIKNLAVVFFKNDRIEADLKYKDICDRLHQMNMIDASYQMEEFESIRTQYQYAFYRILSSSKGRKQPSSVHFVWPDFATSHYHREFEELEYIAGGGFGKVYRVRHKLDGTEYAVKKISICSEGLEHVTNYLSEVKTFASMNHPNVVQYKAAWLEMGSTQNNNTLTEYDDEFLRTENSDHKYQLEQHFSQENVNDNKLSTSFLNKKSEDSSNFEVVFQHSINNIESCSITANYSEKKSKSRKMKRKSVSEGGKALCPLDRKEIDMIRLQQKLHANWATLYIQMALCQSTLKQWLSKRNCVEKMSDPMKALVPVKIVQDCTVREILKQLLEGLQYIHSKNIVHHDIKPSNIFLQTDNGKLLIQLGDFGLACPSQSVPHSVPVGTKLYAAPEQLAGMCNPKSDMYSLGIVLFELVETFTTDMERCKSIEDLKKTGHLPTRIVMQHPQFADIISRLLNKLPKDRPSAYETLVEISENSLSNTEIKELKCQLAEKDEEILRLKQLLKSSGVGTKEN